MEGIRISGQTLFSDQDIDRIKHEIASILSANDAEVMAWERTITGESTLNTYEIHISPGKKGNRIDVNFGMSTLGIILTLIFLVFGAIIGIIILIIWYLKMDDIKSTLRQAFPGYMPPPQQQYYRQGQYSNKGQPNQYNNQTPPQQSQQGSSKRSRQGQQGEQFQGSESENKNMDSQ